MPERYILRFKVLRLQCALLTNGQQYIITYRRGETHRSTPCYIAEEGTVDFSTMPEGSAIVNFKTGGVRFLPKWIMFRVEEYTRGSPRKNVGETQLDCAEVLGLRGVTASATRHVTFTMYNTQADMVVAVLLYPESHVPLSFGSILSAWSSSAQTSGGQQHETPKEDGNVKCMERSEAMVLLISLETLLERHRTQKISDNDDTTPLQKRLAELEERKRSISGVEGMAARVVQKRVGDVVAAQFLSLSRKHRVNYVGEVAAYLRQLAVTSGVPLTAEICKEEETAADTEAIRGRKQHIDARIATLTQQLRRLEEERDEIGQLQDRADVANELNAIKSKTETLQSQIQLLKKSRDVLEGALHRNSDKVTEVVREVQAIRKRVRDLTEEEQSLQQQIHRMTTVATKHALKWARSRNPPTEDVRTDLESLFSVTADEKQQQQQQQQQQPHQQRQQHHHDVSNELHSLHKRQIMEALSNVAQASAPVVHSGSSSETNEPPEHNPMKLFDAAGLPSMSDFGNAKKELTSDPNAASVSSGVRQDRKHVDPLIVGLGSDMFSNKAHEAEKQQQQQAKPPSWDFGPAQEETGDGDDAWARAMSTAAAAATKGDGAVVFTMDDDPMYDFRPQADTSRANAITVEFDDSSFYRTVAGIGGTKAAVNVFETDSKSFGDNDKVSNLPGLPTYNFDSDTAANGSTTTGEDLKLRVTSYNFAS